MYYIVNYDHFWRYPAIFYHFLTAFMIYEILNDHSNIIEYYGPDFERQIVWPYE